MVGHDPKGYYARLGIGTDADAATVKAAYRRLAKSLHPDSAGGSGSREAFADLAEAYATIGDATLRRRYDDPADDRSAPDRPPHVEPIACHACGRISAQPRRIVVRVVVSLWRCRSTRVESISCPRCARQSALAASVMTGVLGWWEPLGLVATPTAIVANALTGRRQSPFDQWMLLHQAQAFADRGQTRIAASLARGLWKARDARIAQAAAAISRRIAEGGGDARPARLRDPWNGRPWTPLAVAAHLTLGLLPATAFGCMADAGWHAYAAATSSIGRTGTLAHRRSDRIGGPRVTLDLAP